MAWLCFNDAFLSVVNHRDDKDLLVVRVRRREHLVNVFGKDTQITVTPERDYKYRWPWGKIRGRSSPACLYRRGSE